MPNKLSVADESRFQFEPGGGFLAGTLVHTEEGPVPIEQIKVGDWVLSQPEVKGTLAYKRVVKTFVHEDKTIRRIDYVGPADPDNVCFVYATDNHPFWVEGQDWTRAEWLAGESERWFELMDGSKAYVVSNCPVFRTSRP